MRDHDASMGVAGGESSDTAAVAPPPHRRKVISAVGFHAGVRSYCWGLNVKRKTISLATGRSSDRAGWNFHRLAALDAAFTRDWSVLSPAVALALTTLPAASIATLTSTVLGADRRRLASKGNIGVTVVVATGGRYVARRRSKAQPARVVDRADWGHRRTEGARCEFGRATGAYRRRGLDSGSDLPATHLPCWAGSVNGFGAIATGGSTPPMTAGPPAFR